MPNLFKKDLLDRYLEGRPSVHPSLNLLADIIKPWVRLAQGGKSGLTEVNLDIQFLESFFVNILGYKMPPGEEFTLVPKKAIEARDTPDFRLGSFIDKAGKLEGTTIVVGELKGPGLNLDKASSSTGETPIQQAFRYGRRSGLNVVWILVSNMSEIRLYRVNSEHHFESFEIPDFLMGNELTSEFWKFYHLLRSDAFLEPMKTNPIANLISSSIVKRIQLTDAFYKYYRKVLSDVFDELANQYPTEAQTGEGKERLARSAQKLLHRALMVCFMSDHPKQLLPKGILSQWIRKARSYELLGDKIFPSIRTLFRYIDKGNPTKRIFAYNGGLFAEDPFLDSEVFVLPDSYFDNEYDMNGMTMTGVFGFTGIDFYNELSPHLLGRLFEHSIADQEEIFRRINSGIPTEGLANLQGDLGIVYTREVLAEFASRSALNAIFMDMKKAILAEFAVSSYEELATSTAKAFWEKYLRSLKSLRIVDLSVGSGAFLVECYKVLRREAENAFEMSKPETPTLLQDYYGLDAEILDSCFFGKDILPGAVAVAELALWLASAHENIRLTNFQDNFIVGDTLGVPGRFPKVEEGDEYQKFDLVIGNPPWGGEVTQSSQDLFRTVFPNAEDAEGMDTFERFVHVGSKYLKEGGRLCYILPQSILYSKKKRTRKFILENFRVEKWHYLGADWFGSDIRMNTTILQFKNELPTDESEFLSMTLIGKERRQAINGELGLEQLEVAYAFGVPQARCKIPPKYEVQLFRYSQDDTIMEQMELRSYGLADVCYRARGVELNKAGNVIQCPSCFKWDAPPSRQKGVEKEKWLKVCTHCGHKYPLKKALARVTIVTDDEAENLAPYVDGDCIGSRYAPPSYRRIVIGLDGINYKTEDAYREPKVLIRKTGMGLTAAYDEKGAYCPQTVFIYRPSKNAALNEDSNESDKSWNQVFSAKFLLGILHSRVLSYYFLKRYGEIDNAQAFSHVTHTKLAVLPIPVRNWDSQEWRKQHARVVELVNEMLKGAPIGSAIDFELDRVISDMYGLDGLQRAHIMGQFGLVEYHQAIKELFPTRPPRPETHAPLHLARIDE